MKYKLSWWLQNEPPEEHDFSITLPPRGFFSVEEIGDRLPAIDVNDAPAVRPTFRKKTKATAVACEPVVRELHHSEVRNVDRHSAENRLFKKNFLDHLLRKFGHEIAVVGCQISSSKGADDLPKRTIAAEVRTAKGVVDVRIDFVSSNQFVSETLEAEALLRRFLAS